MQMIKQVNNSYIMSHIILYTLYTRMTYIQIQNIRELYYKLKPNL